MNKRLTIVIVSDIKINKSLNALNKTANFLKPYEAIFLSSKNIPNRQKYKSIRFQKITPLNKLNDYSNFIIFELHRYIKTSHVLIVQWDGYIINPSKWTDDFLKYDYIGAPFVPRVNEFSYCRDIKNKFYTVGNGGFSIRSKRLMEAPSEFKLLADSYFTNSNEDGFFCILHRNFLEKKGFKWAPYKIAKNFSIESPLTLLDIKNLPLGFHGRKMLIFLKIKRLIDIILFWNQLKLSPNNDYIIKSTK